MGSLTDRFLRYSRLIAPDAVSILEQDPGMADLLEEELKGGASVPTIIASSDILLLRKKHLGSDISGPAKAAGTDAIKNMVRAEQIIPPATFKQDQRTVRTEITGTFVHGPHSGQSRAEIVPEIPMRSEKVGKGGGVRAGIDAIEIENVPISGRPKVPEGVGRGPRPFGSEYEGEVKVLKDPLESMGAQGRVEDFRALFVDRYKKLRGILVQQYLQLSPVTDIESLRGSEEAVKFIGMVDEVRVTKNGHTMLTVQDPSGAIRVLVAKGKEISGMRMVNDEVVGIVGKFKQGDAKGGDIVFADEIYKVDIPGVHRRRVSDTPGIIAAFTSDTHVGSRFYLDKEWKHMVQWLRGGRDGSLKAEIGPRVKYLVISGDLVDGIGVYPDQENDLQVRDISKQYEYLAESLSLLPEHVEVILMPGNHDAVRLAEPQPPIPKELQEYFSFGRMHFLSNPTLFSLSGVQVAGYHGKSLDDMVTIFKDVTYENPIQGMREMLRMRHFSPCYGMRNQLAPEESDMLVIETVPDVFISGHVHRFQVDAYKGVQLIQGSAWQSQTPFQRMMNFKPQPARMAVMDLSTASGVMQWHTS